MTGSPESGGPAAPASPIRFLRFVHLRGPSIWTYRPVLEAWVDIGDLEDRPSNTIQGFPERLAALLPGLVEHRCSYGERGGFLRRLAEGTWPAHILEHVTLELQGLAGLPGGFGRARSASSRGIYRVAVRAWDEEVTRAAFHLGRDLLLSAMDPQTQGPVDVAASVATLRELADARLPPPLLRAILGAGSAKDRCIPGVLVRSGRASGLGPGPCVQLGYGAAARLLWPAPVPEPARRDAGLSGRSLPEGAQAMLTVDGHGIALAWGDRADVPLGRGSITRIQAGDDPELTGRAVVDALFSAGDSGRIPVVGVAGSRGTNLTARLAAWLLGQPGGTGSTQARGVGLACRDGLILGGRRLESGDAAHWDPAQRLLRHPGCRVAVIENGVDALLAEGLAYDRCQVGVVTNLDPARLPEDDYVDGPERLWALMRTQVDVVLPGGAAVLNAGDPRVAEMAPLSDGEVIFFAADPTCPLLAAHRSAGGRVLTLADGRILVGEGVRDRPVADLRGLAWLDGRPARDTGEALLAAVSAAWALGLAGDAIGAGLATFDPGGAIWGMGWGLGRGARERASPPG